MSVTESGIALMDYNECELSDLVVKQLNDISAIINIIIADREKALDFVNDPNAFIRNEGLNINLNLTDDDIRVLSAFADDEVVAAIQNADIEKFFKVCKEKGYIGFVRSQKISQDDIRGYFKTEQDYNNFMLTMDNMGAAELEAAGFIPIIAVAIAGIYAAGESMVGLQVGAIFHVSFWVETNAESTKPIQPGDKISTIAIEPVTQIWVDNRGAMLESVCYTQLISDQLDKLADLIEEYFPEVNKEMAKQIIKGNLEVYYELQLKNSK